MISVATGGAENAQATSFVETIIAEEVAASTSKLIPEMLVPPVVGNVAGKALVRSGPVKEAPA